MSLSIIGFLALQSSGLQAFLTKEQLLEKADQFVAADQGASERAKRHLFDAVDTMKSPMLDGTDQKLLTLGSQKAAAEFFGGLGGNEYQNLFNFCRLGCDGVSQKLASKYSGTQVVTRGFLAQLDGFAEELASSSYLTEDHVRAMFLLYRWGYLPALDCARAEGLRARDGQTTITGFTTQHVNLNDKKAMPAGDSANFTNFYDQSLIPALNELMDQIRRAEAEAPRAPTPPSPSLSATPPRSPVAPSPLPAPVRGQDVLSADLADAFAELQALQASLGDIGAGPIERTLPRSSSPAPGRTAHQGPRTVHFAPLPVEPPGEVCPGCSNGFVRGSGLTGQLSSDDLCQTEGCPFADSAIAELSRRGVFEEPASSAPGLLGFPLAPGHPGLGGVDPSSSESSSDDDFGGPPAPAPSTRGRGRGRGGRGFSGASGFPISSSSSSTPPALPPAPAAALSVSVPGPGAADDSLMAGQPSLPLPPAQTPAPHAAPVDFAAVSRVLASVPDFDDYAPFKRSPAEAKNAPGRLMMQLFQSRERDVNRSFAGIDPSKCGVTTSCDGALPGELKFGGVTLKNAQVLRDSSEIFVDRFLSPDAFKRLIGFDRTPITNWFAADQANYQGIPLWFLAAPVTNLQKTCLLVNPADKTPKQEVNAEKPAETFWTVSASGLDFQQALSRPAVKELITAATSDDAAATEKLKALAESMWTSILGAFNSKGVKVVFAPALGCAEFLNLLTHGDLSGGDVWMPAFSFPNLMRGFYADGLEAALGKFPGIKKVFLACSTDYKDLFDGRASGRVEWTGKNTIFAADIVNASPELGLTGKVGVVNASDPACLIGSVSDDFGKFHMRENPTEDIVAGEEYMAWLTTISLGSRGMCPGAWENAQPVGVDSPAV